jgi:hypothetical protein
MKILQTPARFYPYIGGVMVLGINVMIFSGGVMRKKEFNQSTMKAEVIKKP